ncbi:unnamed protein product, partial [marine sediment metagenome]
MLIEGTRSGSYNGDAYLRHRVVGYLVKSSDKTKGKSPMIIEENRTFM